MEHQDTSDTACQQPSGYVTRPGVVTFICVTAFISVGLQAPFFALFAIGQYQQGSAAFVAEIVTTLLVLGVPLAVVLGLWHAKAWARIAFVILFPLVALIELLVVPNFINIVRILFVALYCYLLFRPKSSDYFKGIALPPIDPASGLEIGTRTIIGCPSCGKEICSTVSTCHHCGADLRSGQIRSVSVVQYDRKLL